MRLPLPDADVSYLERFLDERDADRLFAALRSEISWDSESIRLFGRDVPVPRLLAWHGDPGSVYAYSGVRHEPRPWTAALLELKGRVEAACGAAFNGVLLNLYRDGRDGMSWHADDEPELGPSPVIASVSLGGVRSFQLKHRARRDAPRVDLPLAHGSLLVMRGETQRRWLHRVPKTSKPAAPRINATFRAIRHHERSLTTS